MNRCASRRTRNRWWAGLPILAVLAGIALLAFPEEGRAQADGLTMIRPRGPDDWRLVERYGEPTVTVSVEAPEGADGDTVWVFRGDALPNVPSQSLMYTLMFADFGIAPLAIDEAHSWVWSWRMKNTRTADMVEFQLIFEDGRSLSLGASHAIYDHGKDYFSVSFSRTYKRVWNTIPEAVRFAEETGQKYRMPEGRIRGLRLRIFVPHEQELWLGPIGFRPKLDVEPPPVPREPAYRVQEGRFVPVDLNGDGVAEVITPWLPGSKVWRFHKGTGAYRREPRGDFLSRDRPLHQVAGGDLDGDGDVDMVATDPNLETIYLLKQRVWGFEADSLRVPLPSRTARVTALLLGDDDGDDRLELFVGYHMAPGSCVFRLPGLKDGRFGPAQPIPMPYIGGVLDGTYFLGLVDLNGDSLPDLVTAAQGRPVHVFPGQGSGKYGEPIVAGFLRNAGPFRDLEFCDVNGDGLLDMYVSVLGSYTEPSIAPDNALLMNRGDFRFEDVAGRVGVQGGHQSEDACFVDTDGRPGLELVLLEGNDLIAFFMDGLPSDSSAVEMRVRTTELIQANDDAAHARRIFCQDLDGDGALEAVLSLNDGPVVLRLPGTGPVRNFRSVRPGPNATRIGATLHGDAGASWSLPLVSTDRTGPMALSVAASERIAVSESTAPEGGWWRWRAASMWEYPAAWSRSTVARWSLGLLLVGVVAMQVRTRVRRSASATAGERWDELLRIVRLTEHGQWRQNLTAAQRAIEVARSRERGDPRGREALDLARRSLPPEMLDTLARAVELAKMLGLDGAARAETALAGVRGLHETGAGDRIVSVEDLASLRKSLDLVSDAVRERYSCAAGQVFASVRDALAARIDSVHAGVAWAAGGEYDRRRFPMAAGDLYAVMDEMLTNALKKHPAPATIRVSAERSGRRARLTVWDDGASVAVEARRSERPGTRAGLAALEERIRRLYHGELLLADAPDGGVQATVLVPDFSEG